MNNVNAQMAELPSWVQIWMDWMMVIFLSSLFFVWKHKGARWVALSLILSMPLGILVFYLSNTVHLLGIVHLLLWSPILIYIMRVEFKSDDFKLRSPYGVWTILLMVTIVISLLFDIRDLIIVMMGLK